MPSARRLAPQAARLLVLAGLAILLTDCGSRRSIVNIKGSDTMVILGQRWAEVYMQSHPGRIVQVTGGGSGTGIAALINGTTEIAQASRSMKDAEKSQAEQRSRRSVEERIVARDGVTVYVHGTNPVAGLTIPQLREIYTGAVTNWNQLGGPDREIVVYGRESSSGTYVFFKEEVLGGADFAPKTQTLPGTAAVADAVGQDPAGIGYGGYAYGVGIRHVPIAREAGQPPVEPGEATVRDGSYPLARPLYWYTLSPLSPVASEFLEWVLSPEGQKVVKEVGYFPVDS